MKDYTARQGLDLMVVQIGLSVWVGTATPPPLGCAPELYELVGNFFFVWGGRERLFYRLSGRLFFSGFPHVVCRASFGFTDLKYHQILYAVPRRMSRRSRPVDLADSIGQELTYIHEIRAFFSEPCDR